MQIALIPDHRVPLVHLQAAVRAGLPSETPETNGLNQLLASTLPKGTATRSAQEIAITLESLGASISAGTGNNALLVQAGGLAPDIATIAAVFAEVLVSPSLPPDAIAREKASQLAALEEAMQDPLHAGFRALRHAAFNGSRLRARFARYRPESLPALDRDALAAHHARHFNAANITLAIAGDFDSAAVLDLLSASLSALPTGAPWPVPAGSVGGGEHLVRLPKKQAVLAIGFPGASVNGADRHALAMIQEYAADMAGPLFSRIREELGLAYQVGATQFLGYDAGLFTFYLATSPEQVGPRPPRTAAPRSGKSPPPAFRTRPSTASAPPCSAAWPSSSNRRPTPPATSRSTCSSATRPTNTAALPPPIRRSPPNRSAKPPPGSSPCTPTIATVLPDQLPV